MSRRSKQSSRERAFGASGGTEQSRPAFPCSVSTSHFQDAGVGQAQSRIRTLGTGLGQCRALGNRAAPAHVHSRGVGLPMARGWLGRTREAGV